MDRSDAPETEKQILLKAERLFRQRNFAEIVRQLAPQVFLFRNSSRYYFLMGVSSLYINDFGGAYSYLSRGKDLDPLNLQMQLGLAIAHLARKEDTEALRIWVGIQDKHPANLKAGKGLEVLKQAAEKVDWVDQLRLGRLRNLYPEPGYDWSGIARKLAFAGGGLVSLSIVVVIVIQIAAFIERRTPPARDILQTHAANATTHPKNELATGPAGLEIFGVFPGSTPRFQLSRQEIEANMAEIRDHFRNYRDNKARILSNKIMQSNAVQPFKDQIVGLSTHFKEPGFTNFRDNIDYEIVSKDPLLYQGTYVKWRGRIADVQKTETLIKGKLLLGYESSKVVHGTVEFLVHFPLNINNDQPVEMIGQINAIAAGPTTFVLKTSAMRLLQEGE